MKKAAALIIILVGVMAPAAVAANPIDLSDTANPISLGTRLEYLEDRRGEWTLEDVIQPPLADRFRRSPEKMANFGVTTSVYWIRFTLINPHREIPEWNLIFGIPIMKHIDLYYGTTAGTFVHKTGGTALSFRQREVEHPSHVFRLTLPYEEPVQVYMRFETDSDMMLNLSIASPEAFQGIDRKSRWSVGINSGILIALALTHLLLFFTIRDRIYFYFVLFLISFGLYYGSLAGYTAQYLWPTLPGFPHMAPLIFGGAIQFFGLLFSIHYMEVPQRHPRFNRFARVILALSLAGVALGFVHYRTANILLTVLGAVLFITLAGFALWSWRKGNFLAGQYLLYWSFYFITGFLFMLTISGILEPNFYLLHGWPFGFSLGGIFMSMALGERINRMQRTHQIELEEKIEERTHSLNRSIHAMNIEIASRRQAEQTLNRERGAFRIIADAAVHAEDTRDLCQRILSGLIGTLGFDLGSVRLYEAETNRLIPVAFVGIEWDAGEDTISPQSLDDPDHPSSLAGRSKETIFAPDVEQHPIWGTHPDRLQAMQARALIAAPIIGMDGILMAVLMLTAHEPKSLAQDDRIFFDTVAGMFAVVLERLRERELLAESEKRYRLLADNVSDVIWTLDQNLFITFVTPSIEPMLGYTPDEMREKFLLELLTPASLERAMAVASREMALEESGDGDPDRTVTVELEQVCKDGSTLWTELKINGIRDGQGGLVGFLGMTRDIRKRKEAEDRIQKAHDELEKRILERTIDLRTSEERYRTLIELAPDIIYTLSAEQQVITSLNPAFEKQTGWKADDFLGKSFEQIVHPDDLKRAKRSSLQVLRGEIPEPYTLRIRKEDGGYFWGEFLSRPKIEGGRVVGEFGIVRDITKRRQVEEEREKLEKQLRQSQKMEAIGRLAGGIAHDFNNILTAILGYADVIFSNLDPKNPIYADVDEIKNSALRAASLIQQLLAFSRKQIISPKPINLNDVVKHSKKMLGRIIGEDIELFILPSDDLWNVLADPGQMEQVLINLAVNARDAMPLGGKLIIRTMNLTAEKMKSLAIEANEAGPHVLLSVTDNGQGMDEEVKRHIFEPFFSTKEKDKGTGLGLATVYGIVSQNRGFLNVFSEPGAGTTFNIYFPQELETVDEKDKSREFLVKRGTERILLVEDEEMVRGLARRILESYGYQVHDAVDGEDALSFCNDFPEPIDLLLTDVVMPKMNGKELYEKLKEERPNMRVLFMSGYAEHTIAHHGVLLTEMPFMQKPFKIKELTNKVREVLDGVSGD